VRRGGGIARRCAGGADMTEPERLTRLLRTRCRHPDVLSVYLRLDPDPSALRSVPARLDAVFDALEADRAGLDAARRKAVAADMDAVRRAVGRAREWLGRGVALFAASDIGLFDELRFCGPPAELAVLDIRPYVRPLLAARERSRPYCAAVVDAEHSWIATSGPEGVREDTSLTTAGPRKPDYGGWHGLTEYRARNHAGNIQQGHFRRTAELLRQAMCDREVDVLIVGGHEPTLPRFLSELPADLRGRLAGTFVIDPHTMTAARVRTLADGVAARSHDDRARRHVRQLIDEHAAGGLAVAGLGGCLEAVGERAVERLFVRANDRTGGIACDRCGVVSLAGDACGSCGGAVRRVPDVIAEAIALVLTAGGQVDQVPDGTALDGTRAVAHLRFPLAAVSA
jgi:peptide subunit release factor 1 (eRF1)